MKKLALLLLLVSAGLFVTGCATANPDADSDIPWNAPQPWESAPTIPGLESP